MAPVVALALELELAERVLRVSEDGVAGLDVTFGIQASPRLRHPHAGRPQPLEHRSDIGRIYVPGKRVEVRAEAASKLDQGAVTVGGSVAGLDHLEHEIADHRKRCPPLLHVGPVLRSEPLGSEEPIVKPVDFILIVNDVDEVEELLDQHAGQPTVPAAF